MDDLDPTTLILIAVVAVLLLKPDLISSLLGGGASVPYGGGGGPYGVGGPYVTLQPPPVSCPSGYAWDGQRCVGLGFHPTGSDPTAPGIPVDLTPTPASGGVGFGGGGQRVIDDPNARKVLGLPPIDPNAEPPPSRSGPFGNGLANALAAVSGPPPAEPPQASPSAPAAVGDVKAAAKRARLFTPLSG